MFRLTIKYLGFLKFIPGLALIFDNWLKVYTLFTNPAMLDWIDEIEIELLKQSGISTQTHKYGGLQFNYNGKELGHIHSNGLLDMPLSRKTKVELMQYGQIQDHHTFKNTGWISFYMHSADDAKYGLYLLKLSFQFQQNRATGKLQTFSSTNFLQTLFLDWGIIKNDIRHEV